MLDGRYRVKDFHYQWKQERLVTRAYWLTWWQRRLTGLTNWKKVNENEIERKRPNGLPTKTLDLDVVNKMGNCSVYTN